LWVLKLVVGFQWLSNSMKVSPPLPPLCMDLAAVLQVSSLMLMEGMLILLFFPGRDESTLHIVVDFGVPAPVVLAMRFHSVLRSNRVPSEPLVPLPLSIPRLLRFRSFEQHPQH